MIRPFHLRDSLLVARLQRRGVPLDLEEQLTHPRSPLRSVLLNTLLSPHAGPSTFIFDQKDDHDHHAYGLAQMRVRPGRPERDIVFLAPSLDTGNGSHAMWQRLLTHLCVQVAEQGSVRVYARLPVESEELQLFKTVGFTTYGQEDIYCLASHARRQHTVSRLQLRPQRPGDSWGLQRLYATVAPRPVQNAEGLAQGQWALQPRYWGEQGHLRGYVWQVDGDIVGALHLRIGKQGYLIRTLLHPDMQSRAEALAQAALSLTAAQPQLPVYFAVRHYEAGWQHTLSALNFAPFSSQSLVVKHMAVRVREKTPGLLPALETPPESAATTSAAARITTEQDSLPTFSD